MSEIGDTGLLYIEYTIDRLYGPPVGTEKAADLQDFLAHLDLLLPNRGIMALKDMPHQSHQSILSALAARGLSRLPLIALELTLQ